MGPRSASTPPASSSSSPGLTTTEAGPETRDWPRNSPQPPSASPLAGDPGLWLVHTLRLNCDWSIQRQPPISRPFKPVQGLVQQICALLDPIRTPKPTEWHNTAVYLMFPCSQLMVHGSALWVCHELTPPETEAGGQSKLMTAMRTWPPTQVEPITDQRNKASGVRRVENVWNKPTEK